MKQQRFSILGAALISVVGGVGWGWAAFELGRLAQRATPHAIAPAGIVAAMIVVFLFIPSWIGSNVVDEYGAKLIHERDRRVLNLLKLEPRRSTRVDHQRHGERFFS